MRTGGPMAFLSGRRAHAGVLLVVWSLALLGRMATAQSDMCYPKPGKRSPLKKGACFMVTHTTEAFFGRDVPPALFPSSNDFVLVDRRTQTPIDAACTRTKVYVSRDGTDNDMGRFKREAWATQAFSLVQGTVHVDFAAIEANLQGQGKNRTKTGGKGAKASGTQVAFMMEFVCPAAPTSSRKEKRSQVSPFRVALRYVPLPEDVTPYNFYHGMMQYILAISGRSEFTDGTTDSGGNRRRALSSSGNDVAATIFDPFNPDNRINHPLCTVTESVAIVFCDIVAEIELGLDKMNLNCTGTYPAYLQPVIDQSKDLDRDTENFALPGFFYPYVTVSGGLLPYYIDSDILEQEKATLAWLFDKTQQLGPWTACANGQVPYAFADRFAPGFGAPTFHRLNHDDFELPGSNFTSTVLAQSSVSDDGNTFLLAFRGTKARSEWLSNFAYNQLPVSEKVLETRPWLRPFLGMRIHKGYADIFNRVYPSIWAAVDAMDPPPQRVIVAGHSLGAAMTQLVSFALAVDLKLASKPAQVDAAMFAPPAAGDFFFAAAFNQVVNGRRLAFASDNPSIVWDIAKFEVTRVGDVVPQAPCPLQQTCAFPAQDITFGVPVSTAVDGEVAANYEAVWGNILFDYRDLPLVPSSYGLPPTAYQDLWRDTNNILGVLKSDAGYNAHICSYSCFLSSKVDADLLAKCLLPTHLDHAGQTIPQRVRDYGVCRP